MQNFKQKKIALAVGASLMVMAGAAQAAAYGTLTGATKTALAFGGTTAGTPATVTALYDTAGAATTAVVRILGFNTADTQGATTFGATTVFNSAVPASATQGAAADDVTIAFLPTGATTPTIIPLAQVGVAVVGDNIEITITPAGAGKIRQCNFWRSRIFGRWHDFR